MKKLMIITVILLSAAMVSGQETGMTGKEKKAAKKAAQIEKTKVLVEAGAWQFDASRMTPMSGRGQELTSSYRVVVDSMRIDCYLPYFGRAYNVSHGSSDSPMSFKGEITDFKKEESKKGGWIISFKSRNKNDNLDFTFQISETGSVNLSVNSTNRQPISYYGNLTEIENRK
ncbi:MAG: DUF4251 domain-containing protein [Bacteroidales bacterium]|nr:DUF4251 domain-containing protein [Bacteroidales bacterium]